MNNYDVFQEKLNRIYESIKSDIANKEYTNKGWNPLYRVSPKSQILIIGQAPGIKAQESDQTWNDLSGNRLRSWLGVDRKTFYNVDLFGLMPMDFYFPGKGKTGDLPPRKGVAQKWHPLILECLPNLKLIILIGQYAQKYYLKEGFINNSTETIKNYKSFLPLYFPLVHPSPRNIGWFIKNPWFLETNIKDLKIIIKNIINK